jgi:hypothetical protein
MNKTLGTLQTILALALSVGSVQASLAQEEKEPKKHHEIRYEMTFKTTTAEQRCTTSIEYEYLQKNTVAVVDTIIGNTDCGASSGEYTFRVRFRDESNELQTLEYPETWQRDDDQPIEKHAEYFIGDNVDLISVGSRKIRCICTSAGVTETETSPEE